MRLIAKAFTFHGRDTRESFFCFCLIAPCLLLPISALIFWMLAYAHPVYQAVGPALHLLGDATATLAAAIIFLAGCRRSRDIGWSPWWAFLLAVPPFSIVILLILLFRRGETDALHGA